MAKNKTVKIGIIGVGNMGSMHTRYMHEVPHAKLTAIADHDPGRAQRAKASAANSDEIELFSDGMELIRKADVDAILIATPHYDHPPLTLAAFKKGIHVLTEKPVGVTAAAAEKVNKAYAAMKNKPVWGAMFQQRTNPTWRKVKQLIEDGEIGQVTRVTWLITNWFRSQAYYNSGGWRATWAGEGGGVLINQCPHNLDLIQWFVGMPSKVTANGRPGQVPQDRSRGRRHRPAGVPQRRDRRVRHHPPASRPGTNRLEISGDGGKIVTNGHDLELIKTHMPVSKFCKTTETPVRQCGQ
jgi:predicted dehydrogenase